MPLQWHSARLEDICSPLPLFSQLLIKGERGLLTGNDGDVNAHRAAVLFKLDEAVDIVEELGDD